MDRFSHSDASQHTWRCWTACLVLLWGERPSQWGYSSLSGFLVSHFLVSSCWKPASLTWLGIRSTLKCMGEWSNNCWTENYEQFRLYLKVCLHVSIISGPNSGASMISFTFIPKQLHKWIASKATRKGHQRKCPSESELQQMGLYNSVSIIVNESFSN